MSKLNRESRAVQLALAAVARGMTKSEAAKKYQVARSTIDRAIQRREEAFLREGVGFPERKPDA